VRGPCDRRALAAVAVVLALAAGALAEEAPPRTGGRGLFESLSLGARKEPIRINSDSLEYDHRGSMITYRGNVQVTQGDVTLAADRLSITYDPTAAEGAGALPAQGGADRIREIVAEGGVRIRQGQRLAEGRRAVFDQAKQTIVLSDGAVLHEGPNQVTGDRIIVYLQEERSVVESGSHSRVRAVLYPESSPDAGATGDTAPTGGGPGR
jgi:lipopolysaccharide export system protein LptA